MRDDDFRDLYARFRDPLFRFGYRLTGSQATAEDLVHDCFVGLFRGGYDARKGAIQTYLFASVRNLARKHYRDAEREYDEPESEAETPYAAIAAKETAEVVRSAVEALPPLQKEVLILFEYEDLQLDEIAVIVDAELAAVKSRLHRARERLRKTLAPLKEVA